MIHEGKLRLKTKGHGKKSWKTQLLRAGVCRQIPPGSLRPRHFPPPAAPLLPKCSGFEPRATWTLVFQEDRGLCGGENRWFSSLI